MPASQLRTAREVARLSGQPGSVRRFAHGWYSTRKLADHELLGALARVLPVGTVFAGETAALIHGIDVRPTSAFRSPFRLCVARPEGARAVRRPGVRCRVLRFEPGDIVKLYGIPCTSPLRTLVDMASAATIDIATRLVECFLQRGFFTRDKLERRIDTMRGRRGIRTLRRAVTLADTSSESYFETAVRIRLREAGLPWFKPQVKVWVEGKQRPYRLDLGYESPSTGRAPGIRLAIECDSDRYHPRSGPKADADRARVQEITKAGWRVLSVRFSALKGAQSTFEAAVARNLGMMLPSEERVPWKKSRWAANRNAWVRDVEPYCGIHSA